jgi:hypothetical protein
MRYKKTKILRGPFALFYFTEYVNIAIILHNSVTLLTVKPATFALL